MFPQRLRAQGFMASLTRDALNASACEHPLTKLVARALGHYGIKETASETELKEWDSPAVKTAMEARVRRAVQQLAANYVSVPYGAQGFNLGWTLACNKNRKRAGFLRAPRLTKG